MKFIRVKNELCRENEVAIYTLHGICDKEYADKVIEALDSDGEGEAGRRKVIPLEVLLVCPN